MRHRKFHAVTFLGAFSVLILLVGVKAAKADDSVIFTTGPAAADGSNASLSSAFDTQDFTLSGSGDITEITFIAVAPATTSPTTIFYAIDTTGGGLTTQLGGGTAFATPDSTTLTNVNGVEEESESINLPLPIAYSSGNYSLTLTEWPIFGGIENPVNGWAYAANPPSNATSSGTVSSYSIIGTTPEPSAAAVIGIGTVALLSLLLFRAERRAPNTSL